MFLLPAAPPREARRRPLTLGKPDSVGVPVPPSCPIYTRCSALKYGWALVRACMHRQSPLQLPNLTMSLVRMGDCPHITIIATRLFLQLSICLHASVAWLQ